MAIFEVESWLVAEGKEQEYNTEMRRWLNWVREHRELFPEWKSVRYFEKFVAGSESNRHLVMWEYENLAAYEAYKARRRTTRGRMPGTSWGFTHHKGVFSHNMMGMGSSGKGYTTRLWIE